MSTLQAFLENYSDEQAIDLLLHLGQRLLNTTVIGVRIIDINNGKGIQGILTKAYLIHLLRNFKYQEVLTYENGKTIMRGIEP